MPPSKAQVEIAVLRYPARQQVSKLLDEVRQICSVKDETPANVYERKLRVAQKQSQELLSTLAAYDAKWIEGRATGLTVEEYAAEFDEMQSYKKKLYEIQATVEAELEMTIPSDEDDDLRNLVKQLVKAQTLQATQTKPELFESSRYDGNHNLGAILKQLANAEEARASNLPKVELKKFTGDSAQFLSWWSEFKTYVHSLSCLTDLQKFKYLKDLLGGDAAACVKSVPVTGENYVKAVNYIMQRFGNPERVVTSIFSKLMDTPKVFKRSETGRLKENIDRFNNYATTLESMSIEQKHYATMMYPLLLRSMPDQLIKTFVATLPEQEEMDTNNIKDPTMEQLHLPELFAERLRALLKFITKEIETEEQTEEFRRNTGGKHHTPNADKSGSSPNNSSQAGGSDSRQGSTSKTTVKEKVKPICPMCRQTHFITQCKDVAKLSIENRIEKLKGARLCTKCLKSGHGEDSCEARLRCFNCKGDHHKFLCRVGNSVASNLIASRGSLMPTGHVTVCSKSKSVCARFVFDSASEKTWITSDCANELSLEPERFEYAYLYVFSGNSPKWEKFPQVSFSIVLDKGEKMKFSALVIPTITEKDVDLVPENIRSKMANAAQDTRGPRKISILFDSSDMIRLVKGIDHLTESTAILRTKVGDVAIGDERACTDSTTMVSASVSIEDFWRLEHIGILPGELESTEVQTDTLVSNFVSKLKKEGQMYSTIINLDPGKIISLPDNYRLAEKQIDSLVRSLSKNDELRQQYIREMNFFVENDFAERLPEGEIPKFYMPHFPVVNESKASYKVRPVFNASAHLKGQLSLNDCIYDMPNLLPSSVEMLLKFRSHK